MEHCRVHGIDLCLTHAIEHERTTSCVTGATDDVHGPHQCAVCFVAIHWSSYADLRRIVAGDQEEYDDYNDYDAAWDAAMWDEYDDPDLIDRAGWQDEWYIADADESEDGELEDDAATFLLKPIKYRGRPRKIDGGMFHKRKTFPYEKRQAHRWMRRMWRALGEDAPTRPCFYGY